MSPGFKELLGPFVVVVVFEWPVVEAVTAALGWTALSTFFVVLTLTVVFLVVWVEFTLEAWVVIGLVVWVEFAFEAWVVWLVVNLGVGAESPPTFLSFERVVLTVVLVVDPGAAALTLVVVMIRPPDFGVVMVVLEPLVVVEFDCLVVELEVEFVNLVVVVEAVEFELTVVALAALVVAVEFEEAIVVAFDLIVVVEVAVELLVVAEVAVVLPDLKSVEN